MGKRKVTINNANAYLPGEILSLKAFKNWIAKSEDAPTVSLKEAKSQWQTRKNNSKDLPGKNFHQRSPKHR